MKDGTSEISALDRRGYALLAADLFYRFRLKQMHVM